MDGILSQDEINALLSGMASGNEPQEVAQEVKQEAQTESALPPTEEQEPAPVYGAVSAEDASLTDVEKDAIGEVANISMGTSATTLYSLVNRKVNITTPVVSLTTWDELQAGKQKPCVFIQIKYTAGLDGSNILILKEHDVKVITDLMMGGDGTNTEGEIGELHLSAISEAMNQMMGSSATSLSQMLGRTIDISPPEADLINLQEVPSSGSMADFLRGTFVKISFRMQIDDLVDSTILQLYPIDFAKDVVKKFLGGQEEPAPEPPKPEPKVEAYVPPKVETPSTPSMEMPNMGMMNMGMPQMTGNVGYQPAQFEAFNQNTGAIQSNENINLIMDVPLEVTVELGRTTKSISEILDFAPGTIIELDKIAGEPIDVLVNGKFVAKGEVVVIEESFGIRVTEILK